MTPAILALGLVLSQATPAPTPKVIADTLEWRLSREKEITADRGWLAVSGLAWLNEGGTTLGSGEGNTVRLADGPKTWGAIVRTGDLVELKQEDGTARALTPAEAPFQIGRTWIQLIKRGDRIGLRLWDPQNTRKVAFEGLKWYDDRPAYKVRGRLIRSETPSSVKIANVIGQVNEYVSPGIVEFELFGKRHQLTPVYETPERNELFYIFKDKTAGKTTYGAGRFVYSALPDAEGFVVIDFNRAYSPPCAFTDFATCPLPPSVNRLDVAIEAGELDPDHPLVGGPQGAQPPIPLRGGFALAQGQAAPSDEGCAQPPRPPSGRLRAGPRPGFALPFSGRLRASGRSDKRATPRERLCSGRLRVSGALQEFGLR